MALDCYCDYESPQVYSSKIVRARKSYRCDECDKVILPGEQIVWAPLAIIAVSFALWAGFWLSVKWAWEVFL